jgi:hypothetical protein
MQSSGTGSMNASCLIQTVHSKSCQMLIKMKLNTVQKAIPSIPDNLNDSNVSGIKVSQPNGIFSKTNKNHVRRLNFCLWFCMGTKLVSDIKGGT